MTHDCLFCKIVQGNIPADKVYEDDEFLAFRDINPQAPSHVLVIPKRHIARITDAKPEDAALLGRLLLAANEVGRREGIAEPGMRYVISTNAQGGQLVFHIHLHVLGGRDLDWPPG
jgi:histidine triad (HIT) family protein